MNFTRAQELALITYGLNKLLEPLIPVKIKHRKMIANKSKGRKWSKAQRAKFIKSMTAKWKQKRKHGKTV